LEFHKFEEGIIRKTKETITYGREAIIDFAKNAECLINKKVNNQIANRYMFDVFQPEISKNLSSKIVDDFFETLIWEIIKSNKIKISSFGTFKVINTKKRIGRNPKTKVETIILPRKVIKFKPSLLVKKKLNSSRNYE